MHRAHWTVPTTNQEAARRAGGRATRNAHRRLLADVRRSQIVDMLLAEPWLGICGWGVQTQLAARLGVHRSTICRDLRLILPIAQPCPTCGAPVGRDRAWWATAEAKPGDRRAWWMRSLERPTGRAASARTRRGLHRPDDRPRIATSASPTATMPRPPV